MKTRPGRTTVWAALACVAVWSAGETRAFGHAPNTSYLKIEIAPGLIRTRFTLDVLTILRVAPTFDANLDGEITEAEARLGLPDLEDYLREHVFLDIDDSESGWGDRLELEWPNTEGTALPRRDWHQILVPFTASRSLDSNQMPRDLLLTYDVFVEWGIQHRVLGEFLLGEDIKVPVEFALDAPDYLFDVAHALGERHAGAADTPPRGLQPGSETAKHEETPMKKFLVLFILIGGVAAAVVFYDPYLKPYLGPLIEKLAGKSPEPSSAPPVASKPESAPGPKSGDPAPKPAMPAPGTTAPPAAPTKAAAPASSPVSEVDRIVEQRYPMPQFVPLSQIVNNWTNVPDRAYPEQVKISEKLPFVLRGSDGKPIGSSIASPGTLVKPVSLRGSTLVVASLANQSMRSEISVEKTDFKQQVEKRYNDFILNMTNRVRQQREKAKVALLAKPETLAALTGGSAASFGPTDDPRLVPVKASLSKGEVKAFNLDEAVGFRWNGPERINGDKYRGMYDTVTVKYEAKTIFGTFPGEAKCLLQSGKVIGWVDPITEDEMI